MGIGIKHLLGTSLEVQWLRVHANEISPILISYFHVRNKMVHAVKLEKKKKSIVGFFFFLVVEGIKPVSQGKTSSWEFG